MRHLHPRGRDCRGVTIDADGAMLGPDCVLVQRAPTGFCSLPRDDARRIQAAALGPGLDPDWLWAQSRRVAAALAKGELALAQIYGLHIPIDALDGDALARLAGAARLSKAGFNPDEPRIPRGEPGAGEWTFEPGDADPGPPSDGPGGSEPDHPSPPPGAGDDEPPRIPPQPPVTAQERNGIVRRVAEWLARAAALGIARDRRVRGLLATLRATAWVVEYWPEIRAYLDPPKSLPDLQNAAANPRPGYQIHHIVEAQSGSTNPQSNANQFGARLEQPDNLVLIPKWKHVLISSWYSRGADAFAGMTPRTYLRGKSWDVQYDIGLRALRIFGVLK